MRIIIDFNLKESEEVLEVFNSAWKEFEGEEGNNISFQISIPTQFQDGRLDILIIKDD